VKPRAKPQSRKAAKPQSRKAAKPQSRKAAKPQSCEVAKQSSAEKTLRLCAFARAPEHRMKTRVLTTIVACVLSACASRDVRVEHHPDTDRIAFARQWKKHRLPLETALSGAVKGNLRDGWTLSDERRLIHRPGPLNEYAPGHFTCASTLELRDGADKTTGPSILDHDIIKEPGFIQSAVFEDTTAGDILIVERRHGGPARGVVFRRHAAPFVFELPTRMTQSCFGEWYPILGIENGRLHIRVDTIRYAIPIETLPCADVKFTIG
jgi:hypothetical protein